MTLPAWWPSDKPYIISDVLAGLKRLPDGVVQCVVTSPPYWGLRDYGTAKWEGGDAGCDHKVDNSRGQITSTLGGSKRNVGNALAGYRYICGKCGAVRVDNQLGLEATPEAYVANMVAVFREVWRVLRDDGTCWLNLGDSYNANIGSDTHGNGTSQRRLPQETKNTRRKLPNLKPKDLVGIPWRVAFALQADGWYLRSDIIWSKPNPMPESVTDRCTKAHEYIFLLTKSARYYYDNDAIKEKAEMNRWGGSKPANPENCKGDQPRGLLRDRDMQPSHRNKRSVWTITTKPFPGSHFATFPPELPTLCIKAGTSQKGACPRCGAGWVRVIEVKREQKNKRMRDWREIGWEQTEDGKAKATGNPVQCTNPEAPKTTTIGWQPSCDCNAGDPVPCVVLDPFLGSGTVLEVCRMNGRQGLGFELNPKYEPLIRERSMASIPKLTDYFQEAE